MERVNISEAKAFNFVNEALMIIGFPENIEVSSSIGDGDRPRYFAKYEKEVEGGVEKHIKPLSIKDFVDLMTLAMVLKGYDVGGIDIRVRDNEICYYAKVNIVTYGDGPRKNKRRR